MNVATFLFFVCIITWANGSNYRIHKKTNGFDHRPDVGPQRILEQYRIQKYFEKKDLLDVLEDQQINIHVKTRMIEFCLRTSFYYYPEITPLPRGFDLHTTQCPTLILNTTSSLDRDIKSPNLFAGGLMKAY
jgi:hypothetical protein